MAVSFSNPTAYNPNDVCGICREPLEKKQVVAHDGPNGANHPMHKACVREWLKVNPICPFCRKGVNTKSLLSWKEKAPAIIKEIVVKTLAALAMTVYLAVIMVPRIALAIGAVYIVIGAEAGVAITIAAGIFAAIGATIIEVALKKAIRTIKAARAEKSARFVSALNELQKSMATVTQRYLDKSLNDHHRRIRRLGTLLTPELRSKLKRSQDRHFIDLSKIMDKAVSLNM